MRLLSGRLVTPPLSARQSQLLGWIIDYSEKSGHFPAQREVAFALSVTLSRAQALIRQLEHRGYVERTDASARNITLTETSREWLRRQETRQQIPRAPGIHNPAEQTDVGPRYPTSDLSLSGTEAPLGAPEAGPSFGS